MRVKTTSISERDLMFVIGGQLFDQAPNRQPRKPEIIMQKVRDAFRLACYNDNEYYLARVSDDETYEFIKKLLMDIPEFVELNLSEIEFTKNISVDDKNRSKFSFVSAYDKASPDSWKRDFIDLDAFIRNVHYKLQGISVSDQDCFCCKHDDGVKDKDICKACTVNPNLEYNYECCRAPKGDYTFACKFDCKRHCYICCEECTSKKESCNDVCDGISSTCGNKIME